MKPKKEESKIIFGVQEIFNLGIHAHTYTHSNTNTCAKKNERKLKTKFKSNHISYKSQLG